MGGGGWGGVINYLAFTFSDIYSVGQFYTPTPALPHFVCETLLQTPRCCICRTVRFESKQRALTRRCELV